MTGVILYYSWNTKPNDGGSYNPSGWRIFVSCRCYFVVFLWSLWSLKTCLSPYELCLHFCKTLLYYIFLMKFYSSHILLNISSMYFKIIKLEEWHNFFFKNAFLFFSDILLSRFTCCLLFALSSTSYLHWNLTCVFY